MKKLICWILLSVIFASTAHTSTSFLTKMSKPSISSLHSQVTELTTQFAALSARLDSLVRQDTLTARAVPAPAEVKVKKSRVKKERDPDVPKRAPGAYVLFCQAERAKTPDVKLLLTELGERWRALTDEGRASFKLAVASIAAVAAAATAVATDPAARTTFQEVQSVAATMSSTVAAKFLRFCVQNPTLDAKTAAARFKALSPEEKAKFNDDGDDTEDYDSMDDDE